MLLHVGWRENITYCYQITMSNMRTDKLDYMIPKTIILVQVHRRHRSSDKRHLSTKVLISEVIM